VISQYWSQIQGVLELKEEPSRIDFILSIISSVMKDDFEEHCRRKSFKTKIDNVIMHDKLNYDKYIEKVFCVESLKEACKHK
jgi:hypothetical protein